HKIFNALITDVNGKIFDGIPDAERALSEVSAGGKTAVDSIFDTYIKKPSLELQQKLPWVKSILKDNAGVVDFDDDWLYTLKWESHNSPSAKEPYGGAYTGIVGVFRDPMGTGRGGKIISGFWSFHTGSPMYDGELNPELHPSQILEGVRKGVEDGGNRSGNPTVTGFVYFDEGFIGKPYIGVGASSVIPKEIAGEPGWEKIIEKDDLAIVIGGRVGADGIHGATESSLEGGKHISAGHVQIGDAYMQKKVQEFVIEARDKLLFKGVQDFGAGGVSSAFGELAEFTNGIELDISKHPAKYHGLIPWQMMVSESQERMGLTAKPEKLGELKELAKKHDIELTVLGTFNDRGKLFVKHGEMPCAFLNMDFLHDGGPRFELEAEWLTAEERGLKEPTITSVDHAGVLRKLLSHENIASYNYIIRQFDHEVQGGSAVKPLVGVDEDVHGDASVSRPVLDSFKGIAFSTGENPDYGKIDCYNMALCNIDETIRKVIAVGGDLKQIPLNDNFGWPSPLPNSKNPDAKFKTAQLWRAAKAVADGSRAYATPFISGKDSMSLDGTIALKGGGEKRVSAPAIVQISTAALIDDVRYCLTMDCKKAGDLVYVLGNTKDELGGSAYYRLHGALGKNVPVVDAVSNIKLYDAHSKASKELVLESSHGIYRGGLITHAALVALAGDLGMEINLSKVPNENLTDDKILYSESAGRFIVTVDAKNQKRFEDAMKGNDFALVGKVTADKKLRIIGTNGGVLVNENVDVLRKSYHETFDGELNES
ncbi:phosphoribosylformylglycinamidine synthase, partial [Candidatus Micrarchaeota archaeon]|nr:phosphoribosylformylglycinamidine synthase [Candidatus Micrarchaeota archaeon]